MTRNNKTLLGIGILVVILLFLGNYHIVTDTGIIKRPYFGFSDIIGSSIECTSVGQVIAQLQHPSLCLALKNYEDSKAAPISITELTKQMDCIEQCPSGSDFERCNKSCNEEYKTPEEITKTDCTNKCNKTYSNSNIFDTDYKKCISACE